MTAAAPKRRRLPVWLRRTIPAGPRSAAVRKVLETLDLATVCRSAKCPNRAECFAAGTATFMILGNACTRDCAFCGVTSASPQPLRADEPDAVAAAAEQLKLAHVVITSVTRDDLPDGGADHFARTVRAVRRRMPSAAIEVLTPDFGGDGDAVETVLSAGCDVFNHNVETAPRLYDRVRPQANYQRSLAVLARADAWRRQRPPGRRPITKSGLMLGLGERDDEIDQVLQDLRGARCDIVTMGQYLQPSDAHVPVARFVRPERFAAWRKAALAMGFSAVSAGPFVRSSYRADALTSSAG